MGGRTAASVTVSQGHAGLLLALASVTVLGCGLMSGPSPSLSSRPAVAACFQDSDLLRAEDLGPFMQIVSGPLSGPPYKGVVDPSHPPDFIADFGSGEIEGFIASLALTGPYRTEENALSSALGYGPNGPGGMPMVPLQGTVVRDNPGLLEAYEDVLQYRSDTAAASWYHNQAYNDARPADPDFRLDGVAGISEARSGTYVLGLGHAGNYEHARWIAVRAGAVDIFISLQSGADLQLDTALGYALPSIRRIVDSCVGEAGVTKLDEVRGRACYLAGPR